MIPHRLKLNFSWAKAVGSIQCCRLPETRKGLALQFECLSLNFCWGFLCFGLPFGVSLSCTVFHPVECSYCHSESMMGFRYRCQQCHNYQLCQDCFWRGHASGSHSNQHQMKEYTSWVREGLCLSADCFTLQPREKPPATALCSRLAWGGREAGLLVRISDSVRGSQALGAIRTAQRWEWSFRGEVLGCLWQCVPGWGAVQEAGSRAPGTGQLLPSPQDSR